MILIFDLDDTLYDEMSFVISGIHAVAEFGNKNFELDVNKSYRFMMNHLRTYGRGNIFDAWLKNNDIYSKNLVSKCIKIYRHHSPIISLFSNTKKTLNHYQKNGPLYLVTDGHKIVQQNKINALNINCFFKRLFITNRFGKHRAKPSLYCFEIIRMIEKCTWSEMVYIGDNPEKDFVNLNSVGALTIRVRTGPHALDNAKPGYDARKIIPDLSYLPSVLT